MTPGCGLLATTAAWVVTAAGPAGAAPADAGGQLPALEAAAAKRAAGGAAGDAAAGARLVLSAVTEQRRLELARALDGLAAGWERRRNPLFVPLTDDDAGELDKLLAAWLPATTAALALTAGWWQSSDGDLAVRPVARCAPGARCVRPAVGFSKDPLERRLRFLAWPVGYAIVVRAASDAEATRLAERVRAADARDTRVALVLTGGDIHAPRPSPGTAAVIRAAVPDGDGAARAKQPRDRARRRDRGGRRRARRPAVVDAAGRRDRRRAAPRIAGRARRLRRGGEEPPRRRRRQGRMARGAPRRRSRASARGVPYYAPSCSPRTRR